jgi:hypothetical protein
MKKNNRPEIDELSITDRIFQEEALRAERAVTAVAQTSDDDEKTRALVPYSDGLPYDHDRIINEIRFYMTATAQGMIEMGKRFILLKEHEGHGRFITCLDDLGVGRFTAWRYMTAARKLANVSRVQHLKIFSLQEGAGKLYALLDIPDEELAEFEETGTLRGLTMDEIDALPVKEVRARLRTRNTQVEQGMLQLKVANAKIDALEEEVRNLKNPKRSEVEDKFLHKMEELKKGFDGYLLKVDPDLVRELDPDADPVPTKRMEAAYISALQYMRMQILTIWDRGVGMYGDAISMPEETPEF